MLTIIPPDAPPEVDTGPGPPRWECKTWSEVALAADRLGRKDAVGQRRWRREAMQPDAPAQWRYLAELIRHIEKKEYAKMEPLTPEDVIAAPRIVTFPQPVMDARLSSAQHRMPAARAGIVSVEGAAGPAGARRAVRLLCADP